MASSSSGSRWWVWLVVVGGVITFSCAGCLGVFGWIGAKGPQTSVYTGNRVPERFVDTMRSVGALDPDEQILYFYSDALVNIEKSFCFVSDRKTAYYSSLVAPNLTAVAFGEIEDARLIRDESFFFDSEIILMLTDGTPISLMVSSENDGDRRFLEAIEQRLTGSDQ